MQNIAKIFAVSALALGAQAAMAQTFDSGIPAGWTCTGNCGTSAADGVVTLAPVGGTAYGWVSTESGVTGVSPFVLPGAAETNGSVLQSTAFSAAAGDALNFDFNYVTSDGQQTAEGFIYADYGWARVVDAANPSNQIALLFTARTEPSGTIIPGFDMGGIDATLTPASVPIIPGAPSWSPLGTSSGTCWGPGCGYTGWINSSYTFASAGNYMLEFGTINWGDTAFQSGMAFDGITIGGNPIPVPEPDSYMMLAAGLGLIAWVARRRKEKGAAA